MQEFTKVVHVGSVHYCEGRTAPVYCEIRYENKYDNAQQHRLSISGVVGPNNRGGAFYCGQIVDELARIHWFAKGWNSAMCAKFIRIWKRWHLNDTQSGTQEQVKCIEQYKKAHKTATGVTPSLDYKERCDLLRDAGLLTVEVDGKPFTYGHSLYEDVPEDVLQWLYNLPDTDRTPAWV